MPTDALTKVDLAERLVQWKIEATNPNHPNHYHADLDAPAANYARISTLLQKLRTAPESFGRDDVVVLFGALNSGQRMKNKVADGNPLPALRATLLELVDGEGEPTAKIEMARQNIKYAASNMLGELYGWANAETAPLYNGCARDALAHLGYRFDPSNYDAFVAAHEQFKQEYLAQVGRLHPDLPLNLEIDKLYNVIDKVDLKQRSRIPEKPFAASSHRFWKIAPGDDAWHWNECRDKGFIAIGWDELGDLSNLDRAGFEARRTEVQQEHPDWSNDALEQVWKVAQIQEGDQIVANRGTAEVLGIGIVTGPYYFVPGVRHGHRLPVRWDDTTRRRVNEGGWRRTLVELNRAKFEAIASAAPIDSGPVGKPGASVIREDQGTWSTQMDSTFSPRAFQLLEGIHAEPTKAYYQAHKDDFKVEVEEPFRRLMARVAAKLPAQMRDVMETEQRIFSRFLKNDWGKGGTWDFYWGAFYPKDGKRTQDAQLSLWMNYQRLEYGFYIGDYGSAQRQRFQQNCETYFEELKKLLGDILANETLIYGGRENFNFGPDGALVGKPGVTWQDFLRNPGRANNDVSVVVSRADVLSTTAVDLVDRIAETYTLLFPLVLLAISDQPLAEIANYLDAIAPGSEEESEAQRGVQPTYSLAECAAETGFSEDTLAGWIRSIERKGQAILYGPPGTGKTFIAERLARYIIGGGDGFWDLVQFHPAYAYEDFIQGIRPKTTDGGGLSYPTMPGRFLEFCAKAAKCQGTCVLIIDEINRANLARVFGELMYLLEYRDREVPLAGGGTLRIPANIRVIGTMNTADRSIALVDHALRRRFAFLPLYPNYDVLRGYHKNKGTAFPIEKLVQLLVRLNNAIHDRHYAVGITFFLREKLPDEIADIWRMEIEPYLDEYFFDQPDKADAFRWDRVQADLQP